jgi:hypothetical protein
MNFDYTIKSSNIFFIFVILFFVSRNEKTNAQGFFNKFIDTTDNYFDLSRWIIEQHGFVLIGAVITEPAVGFGLAGGLGLRYLIAKALGIRMGFDIAKGPEDWAFYVVFGSSWAIF